MNLNMNRSDGELHADYANGNIAAGGELARRGIDDMNARAAAEIAARQSHYNGPALQRENAIFANVVLVALALFGAYWAAMVFLPVSISTPLHAFLGTAVPLAIFAGVAVALLALAAYAAVVVGRVLWAALKFALVALAVLVVWTLAYNIYLLIAA